MEKKRERQMGRDRKVTECGRRGETEEKTKTNSIKRERKVNRERKKEE